MRDTSRINFVSRLLGQVDYSGEFACGKTRSPIKDFGDDKVGSLRGGHKVGSHRG